VRRDIRDPRGNEENVECGLPESRRLRDLLGLADATTVETILHSALLLKEMRLRQTDLHLAYDRYHRTLLRAHFGQALDLGARVNTLSRRFAMLDGDSRVG
jgi:hypothetical protein